MTIKMIKYGKSRLLLLAMTMMLFISALTLPVSAQTEFNCSAVTEIPTAECTALVLLYSNGGGDDWDSDWLESYTPCLWDGIVCEDGSIVSLTTPTYWERNAIYVPAEIADLTNLNRLNISHAPVELPGTIGQLSKLTHLTLEYARLTTLPDEIGELSKLAMINLSDNNFTTFPTVLTTLPALRELYFGANDLTAVPAEIGNISTLRHLHLQHNSNLAMLPAEIGNLGELRTLQVENAQLTSLPSTISNLTNLETLDLSFNKFTTLPAEISTLTNLKILDLNYNSLTTLPDSIIEFLINANVDVEIYNNPLEFSCELATLSTQSIPFVECQALVTIYDSMGGENWTDRWGDTIYWAQSTNYSICNWDGVDCDYEEEHITSLSISNASGDVPAEIGNLTQLKSLDLNGSNIDSLPLEIGNLAELNILNIQNTGLYALPEEIGELTKLVTLNASGNDLVTLPPEIGNLSNLRNLNLRSNQLIELPTTIGNLTALEELLLGGTTQENAHVTYICDAYYLDPYYLDPGSHGDDCDFAEYFDDPYTYPPSDYYGYDDCYDGWEFYYTYEPECGSVGSGNRLTTIPPEIGNLTNLTRLDLDDNELTTLPPEIGNLTKLLSLYISNNPILTIPAEIGNITTLKRLVIKDSLLITVPAELGNITVLAQLDLADNQLLSFPIDLTSMSSLNYLGLENNRLTELPVGLSSLPEDVELKLSGNELTTDFDCTTVIQILQIECEALVAIFNNMDGYGWDTYYTDDQAGEDWFSTTTPCFWRAVTCTAGRISGLQLYEFGLDGAFPSEIGNLTELTALQANWNFIDELPPEIGNLTKLEYLNLYQTLLTSLPPEIGNLTNLTYLDLGSSNLTTLPEEIGNLTQLTDLGLDFNPITSWPTSLTNLQNLNRLDVGGLCAPEDDPINEWVEQYTKGLRTCAEVSISGQLWIERDGIDGFGITDQPLVSVTVQADGNGQVYTVTTDATGQYDFAALPSSTFSSMNYILTVDPAEFGVAVTQIVDPDGTMDNKTIIGATVTQQNFGYFSCAAVTEIPVSECEGLLAIYNETDGRNWRAEAQAGWIQNSMPCSWAGIICEDGYVKELQLGSAGMVGDVPSEIGVFSKLTHLNLWDNRLASLPPELVDLTSMEQLGIGRNRWATFPSHIDQLTNLIGLYLSDAALTTLPFDVGNMTALEDLHLWENELTELPAGINNLINMERLILRENQLTELPSGVTNLTNLVRLDVKYNDLETLPAELETFDSLAEIDIQGNDIPCALVGEWSNIQGACVETVAVPLPVENEEPEVEPTVPTSGQLFLPFLTIGR